MVFFNIIVAMDKNRGIGQNGELPWHLSADLKHFKEITMRKDSLEKKNAVIMGRKTWESLPVNVRPLPGRLNIVLTKNNHFKFPDGVLAADHFKGAFNLLDDASIKNTVEKIFVIGGAEIFKLALPSAQILYMTHVHASYPGDVFFPQINWDEWESLKKKNTRNLRLQNTKENIALNVAKREKRCGMNSGK